MASMQRDIMDGHPSELEAQNGAMVHMGQMHQYPHPRAFIYLLQPACHKKILPGVNQDYSSQLRNVPEHTHRVVSA